MSGIEQRTFQVRDDWTLHIKSRPGKIGNRVGFYVWIEGKRFWVRGTDRREAEGIAGFRYITNMPVEDND